MTPLEQANEVADAIRIAVPGADAEVRDGGRRHSLTRLRLSRPGCWGTEILWIDLGGSPWAAIRQAVRFFLRSPDPPPGAETLSAQGAAPLSDAEDTLRARAEGRKDGLLEAAAMCKSWGMIHTERKLREHAESLAKEGP